MARRFRLRLWRMLGLLRLAFGLAFLLLFLLQLFLFLRVFLLQLLSLLLMLLLQLLFFCLIRLLLRRLRVFLFLLLLKSLALLLLLCAQLILLLLVVLVQLGVTARLDNLVEAQPKFRSDAPAYQAPADWLPGLRSVVWARRTVRWATRWRHRIRSSRFVRFWFDIRWWRRRPIRGTIRRTVRWATRWRHRIRSNRFVRLRFDVRWWRRRPIGGTIRWTRCILRRLRILLTGPIRLRRLRRRRLCRRRNFHRSLLTSGGGLNLPHLRG